MANAEQAANPFSLDILGRLTIRQLVVGVVAIAIVIGTTIGSAIFIVKIGGQLDVNSGTHILLANNAQAGNIYWFVDGAVNVANNSTFKGVIVARGSVIFSGTSSLDGRALVAPLGAITLSSNSVGPFAAGPGNNITVTRPAQGDTVKAGTTNYQITWTGSGIAPKKTFEYSLDSGSTFSNFSSSL